jgi:hypothetical protein
MSEQAEAVRHLPDRDYKIVVNGQPKTVESPVVSYDQVVNLAFPTPSTDPNTTYIITYRHAEQAKHDGTLVEGATVRVRKEGTVFNVTRTTKS